MPLITCWGTGRLFLAVAAFIGVVQLSTTLIAQGVAFTEFPVPGSAAGSAGQITPGADSTLWCTKATAEKNGRITTAGAVTEFPMPSSDLTGITTGPDGALWFTKEAANKIGRITITTAAVNAHFHLPQALSQRDGITSGSDSASQRDYRA
jgi:virginiamycin B lyase